MALTWVYGILKALVAALVMPIPIVLGLVLCSGLFLAIGRRRAGFRIIAGAAIFLVLASWWPVAEGLLAPLENSYPSVTDVAAVVVLGGGWRPHPEWPITSQLNQNSAIRLFEGLHLLRALPDARLIVSGGSRSADPRFGRVPRWAIERVDTAAMTQLDAWLTGIFDAQSLEDLLGPKPHKKG